MQLASVNPVTGKVTFSIDCWSSQELDKVVDEVCDAQKYWQALPLRQRIDAISCVGDQLKQHRDALAALITQEMGKVISESYAEIDKCIFTCEYYAENAERFLCDESIASDASHSFISYEPMGTVLGIMPWNFPFWQVFRFAVPALLTGNSVLLKHASNVPQSAMKAEEILHMGGVPGNVFRSLMIHSSQIEPLITNDKISGLALTGSEATGRKLASLAGKSLKKMVLELGGSDAFIVLEDADIDKAVETAIASRFFTSGQSCINAKRIILVDTIADIFMEKFVPAVKQLQIGDPSDPQTKLGPMARRDLRDKLHKQVKQSISSGAKLILGGEPLGDEGFFYKPSILDYVSKSMPVYGEEVFGPVACVIRVKDESEAVTIANDSAYGLGGSVWTKDIERGKSIARQIETGTVYVNGLMKSDPRLPFGGIKRSGFGRELGRQGMLEFANVKTIWLA